MILDNQTRPGKAGIGFSVPNGTYTFSVSAPSGYSATPGGGSVRVQGAPLNESIKIAPTGWGFLSFLGPSPVSPIAVLVALGVALIAITIVVWRTRRRRRPPTSP